MKVKTHELFFFIDLLLKTIPYFLFYFFTASTIFSLFGLGDGKNEVNVAQFMDTFRKNLDERRREEILNIRFLFADECFLFSNLILAVLYEILSEVFDLSFNLPTSKFQIVFAGDPLQMKNFDKRKNYIRLMICGFIAIPSEGETEGMPILLESLFQTGLSVLFLSQVHRSKDDAFLTLVNKVFYIISYSFFSFFFLLIIKLYIY